MHNYEFPDIIQMVVEQMLPTRHKFVGHSVVLGEYKVSLANKCRICGEDEKAHIKATNNPAPSPDSVVSE